MFSLILEVTDANEFIAFTPHNGNVWKKQCTPEEATFYKKRLDEEIIIRTYFNKMPGEIIGRYIQLNPFLTTAEKYFYFQPVVKHLLM